MPTGLKGLTETPVTGTCVHKLAPSKLRKLSGAFLWAPAAGASGLRDEGPQNALTVRSDCHCGAPFLHKAKCFQTLKGNPVQLGNLKLEGGKRAGSAGRNMKQNGKRYLRPAAVTVHKRQTGPRLPRLGGGCRQNSNGITQTAVR